MGEAHGAGDRWAAGRSGQHRSAAGCLPARPCCVPGPVPNYCCACFALVHTSPCLQRKLDEQREKGVLQAVPRSRHHPPAHSGRASRRRLSSTKEFVTNKYDWQASSFGKPTDGGDVLYSHPSPPPPEDDATGELWANDEAAAGGTPAVEGDGRVHDQAAGQQAAGQYDAPAAAAAEHGEQQPEEQQAAPAVPTLEHYAEQAGQQAALHEGALLEGEPQQGRLEAAASEVQLGSAPSREEL